MKKKFIVLFVISLMLSSYITVFSADDGHYVLDENEILTDDEISELNNEADKIYKEYGVSAYLLFTAVDEDSFRTYVESFYRDAASASDRIVLGLDAKHWYIYTHGAAKEIFPESEYNDIWNNFFEGNTWFDAAKNYFADTAERIKASPPIRNTAGEGAVSEETVSDQDTPSSESDTVSGNEAVSSGSIDENTDVVPIVTTDGQGEVHDIAVPEEDTPVELMDADPEYIGVRLNDMAGLLSGSEETEIREHLDALSKEYNTDIVVVTADTLNGMSPRAFADSYYDSYGFLPDGVLLLVSMEDRDWYISTTGECRNAIDSERGVYYIGDKVVKHLSAGNYYKAFNKFSDLSAKFIKQAQTGKPYRPGHMPKDPMGPVWYIVSVVLGFIISGGNIGKMKADLKSVAMHNSASDYVMPGTLKITNKRDTFLYNTVTRTERVQSSSSSGSRSGGGGGGGSHGGGGGKF